MCDAIKDYTPSGKIKRPSYSLIANWVKESWDSMDINMIRNSFKCCGISNDMNGSENNLIFVFNQSNKENLEVEEDNEEIITKMIVKMITKTAIIKKVMVMN